MLKGAGVALAGSAFASGASADSENNTEGDLPNKKVPYTYVYPFVNVPQEKEAGRWIVHRTGWIGIPPLKRHREGETYVSTYDEVSRFVESINTRAWIDGEEIENADQYWREPEKHDGNWIVYWDYATPPKPPGEYTFKTAIEFEETYVIDEEELGIVREKGTINTRSATYSVVPQKVHNPK